MSRQRSACMVSAALLCLTLPRLGAAQEAGLNPDLPAALQALRPGHLVRISVHGVRDTGRVAVASSSQLAFRPRKRMAPADAVPTSTIDSLWTWKSHAGTGARIGGIVVGALGAFTGLAFSGAALDYEPSGAARLKTVVPFGIAGGLMGALFGGTIGSMLSHWTLVHPSRP
jgi:hypothetical protein